MPISWDHPEAIKLRKEVVKGLVEGWSSTKYHKEDLYQELLDARRDVDFNANYKGNLS